MASTNVEVKLKNVRLSFAHLFKPQKSKDGGDPKFNCSFLLDKTKQRDQIDLIKAAINEVKKAKWGDNPPKIKGDKLCLRDGEPADPDSGEREALYDGYAGMLYLSASNAKRPAVVDRDRTPLAEADGRPYSGCFVNAIVNIWAQDNDYGIRINASLEAVQFVKDGEAFGAKPIDPNKAFDDLGDDDDAPKTTKKTDENDDEL